MSGLCLLLPCDFSILLKSQGVQLWSCIDEGGNPILTDSKVKPDRVSMTILQMTYPEWDGFLKILPMSLIPHQAKSYKWNVIKIASSLTQFKDIFSKACWNYSTSSKTLGARSCYWKYRINLRVSGRCRNPQTLILVTVGCTVSTYKHLSTFQLTLLCLPSHWKLYLTNLRELVKRVFTLHRKT